LKPTIYESMFILHPGEAAKDMDAALQAVTDLVTKAGGKVLDCRKWDDRRLAYEIKGQKRGIYILVHFESQGAVPNELQRLAGMSELVLRVQTVIDADGAPPSEKAEAAAATAEGPAEEKAKVAEAPAAEAVPPADVVLETAAVEKADADDDGEPAAEKEQNTQQTDSQ